MSERNLNYHDLSRAVRSELAKRKVECPSLDVLDKLFHAMYYASLRTEESEPVTFHIVYLDPNNPDPDPPARIRNDRWMFVRLDQAILISITNLIKIAKASDPRTSVGHLVASVGFEKIAELRINTLVRSAIDVLSGGPIFDAIAPGINNYLKLVKKSLPADVYKMRDHWDESLKFSWLASLCRLLLRIQKYQHGGAVLITPGKSSMGLNVKYKLRYDRLRRALEKQAVLRIKKTFASDQIWEEYIEPNDDDMPIMLYLEESVALDDLADNRRELDGAIWFVSLLTRVDGLVLLDSSLGVRGFGVEITYSEEPPGIFLAGNRSGSKPKLRELDYNHYGTRHRSMMRFCSKVPGSVGFVVSQDGDVRVMTKVDGPLLVWENLKLQHYEFVRRKKS